MLTVLARPRRFIVVADSDSNIVRGLIAILEAAYNGKSAREILQYDIDAVFQRLNLQQHISPQRRNGLRGMVERIMKLARLHLVQRRATEPESIPEVRQHRCSDLSAPHPSLQLRLPTLTAAMPSQFDGSSLCCVQTAAQVARDRSFWTAAHQPRNRSASSTRNARWKSSISPMLIAARISLDCELIEEFEGARTAIATFLNAPAANNIVFTPGTTIGINMIASGWGRKHVQPGDEILTTVMEHHANFVPWQQLAKERGAKLKLIPLTSDGRIDMEQLDSVLTKRTRVLAITGMSNMLGTDQS
jgi:cysteine desulfurase/selenocysteine lyase